MINKYDFRMWIIFKLQNYSIACWPRLVMWANGPLYDPFFDLFQILRSFPQSCIDDAASSVGVCYCGKFRNNHKPEWSEKLVEQMEQAA